MFDRTVYVKVYENKLIIKHIEYEREIEIPATEPYTTRRMLVGEFFKAEKCLKKGIKQLHKGKWLSPPPSILIQPMKMIEGGLCEVEHRVLKELAAGVGARKIVVWLGHELSNAEVLNKLKSA